MFIKYTNTIFFIFSTCLPFAIAQIGDEKRDSHVSFPEMVHFS